MEVHLKAHILFLIRACLDINAAARQQLNIVRLVLLLKQSLNNLVDLLLL